MVEFGCKIEEKVKAIQSDIKEDIQGSNTEEEGNQDSIHWFGAEGRNEHSTRTE